MPIPKKSIDKYLNISSPYNSLTCDLLLGIVLHIQGKCDTLINYW